MIFERNIVQIIIIYRIFYVFSKSCIKYDYVQQNLFRKQSS